MTNRLVTPLFMAIVSVCTASTIHAAEAQRQRILMDPGGGSTWETYKTARP